ncbi:MAG TPA: aminodeoxychorismate lyase, partial [candidate division Zixibacteria bacterium]|nr:aminodeoxychorismate lyase [candidate division Zixibacteria bacterium]
MPNESDKNEKTAVTPAAAAPPPDQPAPAPGGKKKLLLFGGIGLAAVVVGIVLALGVVKPM